MPLKCEIIFTFPIAPLKVIALNSNYSDNYSYSKVERAITNWRAIEESSLFRILGAPILFSSTIVLKRKSLVLMTWSMPNTLSSTSRDMALYMKNLSSNLYYMKNLSFNIYSMKNLSFNIHSMKNLSFDKICSRQGQVWFIS